MVAWFLPVSVARGSLAVGCLLVGAAAGCADPPAAPSRPPLEITCPAPQSVQALDDAGAPVSFQASAAGGVPPVAVSCAPASGATFPVGTTPVTCTVQDAARRTTFCTFSVEVAAPPRAPELAASRFLAFGDSLTEGKTGDCVRSAGGRPFVHDPYGLLTRAVPTGRNYPTMLEVLLAEQYAALAPAVVNEGAGGEQATARRTSDRLIAALAEHGSEVLLLLEGVNDLHADVPIDRMVAGLQSLIGAARSRGVEVFLGTLLPQRDDSCRAYAPELIAPANAEIRSMAAGEGVAVVDLDLAFAGRLDVLLGEDGLHPTDAGYATMARAFFDAIRARLERPAATHAR